MMTISKSIQRLLRLPSVPVEREAELLRRFVVEKDQASFELLVHRHGPMIMGLCRKLVRNHHDAEDAFQATFLTLAHQARKIRQGHSLGSWLFKVAMRTCQKLRSQAKRTETALNGMFLSSGRPNTRETSFHQDEVLLLASEIERLPETLRTVVILCHVQGKTVSEAARELKCPANTVSVRLKRAKERLHDRLTRRGVVMAGGFFSALSAGQAMANISPDLAVSLARTSIQISSGVAYASLVSPSVSLLLKGAMAHMWWKPLKLSGLAVVFTAIVGVPVQYWSSSINAQQPGEYSGAVRRSIDLNRFQSHRVQTQLEFMESIRGSLKLDQTYPQDDNLPDEAKKWIAEQKKQEEQIRQEAEKKIRETQHQLHAKLKAIQDVYTKSGDLDRAVAIRDQVRRLEFSLTDAQPDPGTASAFRGRKGETLVFKVIGRTHGSIWGSDNIYTDDSDLGTAAVHAGLVRPGQVGVIQVTILDGMPKYSGSLRNGVTSNSFDSFGGSIQLSKPSLPSGDEKGIVGK